MKKNKPTKHKSDFIENIPLIEPNTNETRLLSLRKLFTVKSIEEYFSDLETKIKYKPHVNKIRITEDIPQVLFMYMNAVIRDSAFTGSIETELLTLPKTAIEILKNEKEYTFLKYLARDLSYRGELFLINALYFQPFWENKLSDFKYDGKSNELKNIEKLFMHLFGKYPIPCFLINAWTETGGEKGLTLNINAMCLALLIAKGISLKRSNFVFGWDISNILYQYLFKVPLSYSILQGYYLALFFKEGGTEKDFKNLFAENHFGEYDPLNRKDELIQNELKFYNNLFSWLIARRKDGSIGNLKKIINWAYHKYTEEHNFSLKRYSYNAAFKNAFKYDYYFSKSQTRPTLYFVKHNLDWEYIDPFYTKYSIKELVNSIELFVEAVYLKHCVGSYAIRCWEEKCAIFSLKKNNNYLLTIEISPKSREIKQIRGYQNRLPSSEEMEIVKKWEQTMLKKN